MRCQVPLLRRSVPGEAPRRRIATTDRCRRVQLRKRRLPADGDLRTHSLPETRPAAASSVEGRLVGPFPTGGSLGDVGPRFLAQLVGANSTQRHLSFPLVRRHEPPGTASLPPQFAHSSPPRPPSDCVTVTAYSAPHSQRVLAGRGADRQLRSTLVLYLAVRLRLKTNEEPGASPPRDVERPLIRYWYREGIKQD